MKDSEFATIYSEAREPLINRMSWLLQGDRHSAEDVVQEGFTKAYQKWDQCKDTSKRAAWIARIIQNQGFNLLRSNLRKPYFVQSELLEVLESGISPEFLLDADERYQKYEEALESMPSDLRQAFEYRETESLSYKDIADRMNIVVATARTRVHRAREFIKREINS